MSIDVNPETQLVGTTGMRHRNHKVAVITSARLWKRSLLGIGGVAILGAVGVLLARSAFVPASSPRLTHTIKRGDLVVTVTEQGTLESSNNTEIACKVRGFNTVTWVVPGGTYVEHGDELVRLDTKRVEEAYSLTKTNEHIATATLERSKADVAKSEIAIDAYLKGRYRTQKKMLETELEIAKRNLANAQTMFHNSETLFQQGYVTELEVEGNAFTVTQAELELKVKQTEIDVLDRFTKEMQLETLRGNLTAAKSKLQADEAGLAMEQARRQRAADELAACVIRAERSGLVIYPSAAAWKDTPDITQGATVRRDQVLLLMPDLSQMQVKVGVHESIVDRIRPGLAARVTLPDRTLDAEVTSVASVTKPAGWWTGNVVKYDAVIKLPDEEGLKPGMSAEVEVIIAVHENVVTIPVAAVVETSEGDFCWVQTADGVRRRSLRLGDTDDVFLEVKAGLKVGDRVMLNPLANLEEASNDAAKTIDDMKLPLMKSTDSKVELSPPVSSPDKQPQS